jgi:pantoate kinase
MIPSPIAYSPGSVTGFFVPHFGPSPSSTYSRGFAINLDTGVTTSVRPSPTHQVHLNGRPVALRPVRLVVDELAPEPVALHLETSLPIGSGFGVSAGGALGAAFAIDRRFGLGRSREELGMIAHGAEIRCRTGVGDVASQLCGGIVFRHCRSGPFDCVRLDQIGSPTLYYRSFGSLSTSDVLGSAPMATRLTAAGLRALDWLEGRINDLTLDALLDRSLEFAEESGLLTNPSVCESIDEVRSLGGRATMIMIGQSVLATLPAGESSAWTLCGVDPQGTRLLP